MTSIRLPLIKFAFYHLTNNVSMKRNLIRFFRVSLVASLAISLGTSPASACWLLKRLSCRFLLNNRNSSLVFSEVGRCSTSTTIVKDVTSIEQSSIQCQIERLDSVDSVRETSGVPHEHPLSSKSKVYSDSSGVRFQEQPPSSVSPSEQTPAGVVGDVPNVVPSATDLEERFPKESAEPNATDHLKVDVNDNKPPASKDQVDVTEKTDSGWPDKPSQPAEQDQPVTDKDSTEPSNVTPIPPIEPSAVHPDKTIEPAAMPATGPEISSEGSKDSPRKSDPLDDLFGDAQSKPANGSKAESPMPVNDLNTDLQGSEIDETSKSKSLREDLFGDSELSSPSSDSVPPASTGTSPVEPGSGDAPAASDQGGVPIEVESNGRDRIEASLETSEKPEISALPDAFESNSQKVNDSLSPADDSPHGNPLESQEGDVKVPEKQSDLVPMPEDFPAKPATDAVKALDDLFGDRTESLNNQASLVSAVEKPEEISIEQSQKRFWSDNTGKFSTSGKLILVSEDFVRLVKDTGKTCTVKIERLSEVDRQYVNSVRQGVGQYESK